MTSSKTYPTALNLWKGVVLASIAGSMWQSRSEFLTGGRTWNGQHYWLNNDQGTFGVIGFRDPIAFADKHLVGLICDTHSERAEWTSGLPPDWRPSVAGMPADLLAWVEEELLDYMRQAQVDDEIHPMVTATFWNTGTRLTAPEPWPSVIKHGAHILAPELMDFEEAVEELVDNYVLNYDEDFLRRLYRRKMSNPERRTTVTADEAEEHFYGDDPVKLEEARNTLAAIGILLP